MYLSSEDYINILQKQLDNALQDAKDTEAHAQSVLNAHQQ